MLIYLVIYSILFYFAVYHGKHSKITLIIFTLLLFLMCALRGDFVGRDTHAYLAEYNAIMDLGYTNFQFKEPVAVLIMKLGLFIKRDPYCAQISAAFFSSIPLIWIFRKASPQPLFSLFLYYACNFYLFSFNGVRQALALPALLICFYFISTKDWKKAIVFFIISVLTHNSSLFCLPVFFIHRIELKTKSKIVIFMIASLIMGLMIRNVTALDFLFGSYAGYVSNGDGMRENGIIPILFTVMMDIYFFYIYINCDKELQKDPWMKIFLLAILINNATFMLQWGSRLYLSMSIVQMILYPKIFNVQRSYAKSKLKFIILLFVFINFCRVSFTNGGLYGGQYEFYPYYTFFQKAPYNT